MARLPLDNVLVSQLDIVAVIDGTGPIKDEVYKHDFKNSFCRKIKERCQTGLYRRGVAGEQDTSTIFNSVYSQARSAAVTISGESSDNALAMGDLVRHTGSTFDGPRAPRSPFANVAGGPANPYAPNPLQRQVEFVDDLSNSSGIKRYRIFLVGYSRGGSECIFLANLLQRAGIPVEAMFLFDAVNMTLDLSGYRKIPSNVKTCYHAYRNPKFAVAYWNAVQVAKRKLQSTLTSAFAGANAYANMNPWTSGSGAGSSASRTRITADESELALAQDRLDKTRSDRWTLFSPFNWGNVGLEAADENITRLENFPFDCSHGAMGGMPWPNEIFSRDHTESAKVHDWMWERLQAHNVFPEAKVVNPNMKYIA